MDTPQKLTLAEALTEISDPRKPSNGTRHNFQEILVISICAVLSDCDLVEDIAEWARVKEAWLRQFLVLKNGIPSEDTFLRIFQLIDPKQFESVFRRWVSSVVGVLEGVVAVDGKTVRGSGDGEQSPIHMVSALATQSGLVLGQEKVAQKSNEITAIPELLRALLLKGCLVTIDAMGCQKAIATQIVEQGADYLLAVKGNQPSLLEAIDIAFISRRTGLSLHETFLKDHGRRVGQFAWTLPAEGIVDTATWKQCATVGVVLSQRIEKGKMAEPEWRYYISSADLTPEQLAQATRAHWGIENRLHWQLDVTFREDAATLKKGNAPQNMSMLRKIVLNVLRADTSDKAKSSLRRKRKRAAWDDNIRAGILGLQPLV